MKAWLSWTVSMSMSSSSIALNYDKQKQSRQLSVGLIGPWLHGNKPRPRTRILKRPVLASSSCCCRTCPGSGGEPSGVSAFLFSPWGGWPTPHTPNETGSGSSSTWRDKKTPSAIRFHGYIPSLVGQRMEKVM